MKVQGVYKIWGTSVLNYLGNKHIAGVKPWGALAKARYIKKLFGLLGEDLDYAEKIRYVTRTIGSRSDFIQKSLQALGAYDHAFEKGFFGLEGVDEETVKFSLLTTALDYRYIKKYVYDDPKLEFHDRTIISDNLKDMFEWLFIRDELGRTKLGESRNLKMLSEVVNHVEALLEFKRGASLQQAYSTAGGLNEDFDILTVKIQSSLRNANSMVAEIEKTEEREDVGSKIFRQAKLLRNALQDDD